MKVCVIQPAYSMNTEDHEACFEGTLRLMEQCDKSLDLIVLPEYADIPVNFSDADECNHLIGLYNKRMREAASCLAKRCHALVFVNFAQQNKMGFSNVTHTFDREGREIGLYFKAHPAPSEVKRPAEGGDGMDCDYSYVYRRPNILEVEGMRIAFLTCYDFYMYESFSRIGRENVDLIIGCALQRTDAHQTLETIGRFLCYNTNAYLVRASVSLGEDSPVCGCSMVADPWGNLLVNMKNQVGLGICEIDINKKHYKPAGFKGKERSHHEYIDEGRRPWLYRPAGSMMIPSERIVGYPRLCAGTDCPAGILPGLGMAVGAGVKELSLDLWSDGAGGFTVEPPQKENTVTLEAILQKFACMVEYRLRIRGGTDFTGLDALLYDYDCEDHVSIASDDGSVLTELRRLLPSAPLCLEGEDGILIPRATVVCAEKVCVPVAGFSDCLAEKAHEAGLQLYVRGVSSRAEADAVLAAGADAVIVSDLLRYLAE